MKYVLWNNKGGVGKTYLTFVIATAVASKLKENNDDRKVVVVDMCPQANISEILLGGNEGGSRIVQEFMSEETTVSGYFKTRMASSLSNLTGGETQFIHEVHAKNKRIPDNLYLIPGDSNLEMQPCALHHFMNVPYPTDHWKNVHFWLRDLLTAAVNLFGTKTIFFIDCNPSFSIYTELAIAAADRMIVPCSPDGSSIRAVRNVAELVYGCGTTDPVYGKMRFPHKMKELGLHIPPMHLFVSNLSTPYTTSNGTLAKAFQDKVDALNRTVRDIFINNKEIFSEHRMENLFYAQNPDAHSIGVAMTSAGIPLDELTSADGSKLGIPVSQEQKDKFKKHQESLVSTLGLFAN